MLDRERCIACARCTRFGDLLAGDHALEFIDRGYKTEVGTRRGGPAESKFIGNTIMICPVGALTSQVYRFRARPWDNDSTESTCTLCPVGCSMILDSRDGEIMRTRSLENRDVNDIWLCDKGWFGYEFTSSPQRLSTPLIRRAGRLEPSSWEEAVSLIASKIQSARPGGKLAGFGGNPLTFEECYLFQKLMRDGAGVNHVDHRIGMPVVNLRNEGIGPGMEASIGECEDLSFAVLLGLDLTEEFPVIWLRLRQAINKGAKVLFLGHFAPEIAPYLTEIFLHAPGGEIDAIRKSVPNFSQSAKEGRKGAFFVGPQYLDTPDRLEILSELLKVRASLGCISLNIMEGRGNSLGARLAGMHPERGPFGKGIKNRGMNAPQVIEAAAGSGWDFLYVAGANPALKFPAKQWMKARSNLGFLVVQDLFLTETAEGADVVLPTLSFVEKEGSFINIEGRVQSLLPGKEVPENFYSDAEIFTEILRRLGIHLKIDQMFTQMLQADRLHFIRPSVLEAKPRDDKELKPTAGKLKASFSRSLFDRGVRMEHNPHLSQMAKTPFVRIPSAVGKKIGLEDLKIATLIANGASIHAPVKFDDRVPEGTVVLPLGFEREIPVFEWGASLMNGIEVDLLPINEGV